MTESPGTAARTADGYALAQALQASRADTLATFDTLAAALPDLRVPQRPELNPPLWELGHIGWFQTWWLARQPAWRDGSRAEPDLPRRPALPPDADALYDSSRVPHASRWTLPLPDATTTRAHLAAQLDGTLSMLAGAGDNADDDTLYFFRLALLHEDMHHEAALYMAHGLGIEVADPRWQPRVLPPPPAALDLPAGPWRLGSEDNAGFVFDNELGAHDVALGTTRIDAQAVRWAEFLPFVEVGGYADARWWDAAGLAWRTLRRPQAPHGLRQEGGQWLQQRHGRWEPLDTALAACHLTQHEALAWCRWAGRRLPTEAEWERAAVTAGPVFRWGDVWEWTASAFKPYPGFVAHPYRDYSAPWFDGRPVLRGASFMTQPRMHHPRYRNYFPPGRHDVPAGFRTCPA